MLALRPNVGPRAADACESAGPSLSCCKVLPGMSRLRVTQSTCSNCLPVCRHQGSGRSCCGQAHMQYSTPTFRGVLLLRDVNYEMLQTYKQLVSENIRRLQPRILQVRGSHSGRQSAYAHPSTIPSAHHNPAGKATQVTSQLPPSTSLPIH